MLSGEAMSLINQWVLPAAETLPIWVALSWGLVVSACILNAAKNTIHQRCIGLVAFVVVIFPALKLSGYLALAFQTPCLLFVMWALLRWKDAILKQDRISESLPVILPVLVILLGWGLVFDTLNFWPPFLNFNLYAWGFEAGALWMVIFVAVLVLIFFEVSPQRILFFLLTLAFFSIVRLPTGNIWDAVLDPFIWIICHAVLCRRLHAIYS
jgi:hypothetical protein